MPSHRKAVGIQWDSLVLATEESGGVTGLVAELFQKEVARVYRLPANQQSEAIGKIAGNVIGMIGLASATSKMVKMGGEYLVASAAAKTASQLAQAAAQTAGEGAQAAQKAALLAKAAGNAQQATVLTQQATAHTTEAASQALLSANLAAKASVAKTGALVAKTGAVILNGPAEALVGKMTSAVFNKAYLLIQTSKASPVTIHDAINKALLDNAKQKSALIELGDHAGLEQLKIQEIYLLNAQKRVGQVSAPAPEIKTPKRVTTPTTPTAPAPPVKATTPKAETPKAGVPKAETELKKPELAAESES